MLHSLQVAVYLPCICTERSTTRSTFYPRHFPPSAPPLLCIDLHEISTRVPSYKSTRTPPSSSALLEEKKRIDYLSFYIYIGIRVHFYPFSFVSIRVSPSFFRETISIQRCIVISLLTGENPFPEGGKERIGRANRPI